MGTFRVRDYGDVSENGVITAFDAAMVLQHTVDLLVLTSQKRKLSIGMAETVLVNASQAEFISTT